MNATSGKITDIQFILRPKIYTITSGSPSSIELLGTSYYLLGYVDRNVYKGAVEMVETTNFTKVLEIDGSVAAGQFG